jgi:NAD(P)-dependent dehydrogenase (short-subunit alcohol dehydrogenase family)
MPKAQSQKRQPGRMKKMDPIPVIDNPLYIASGKLLGKSVLITGGDSGIGAATAILFAKEGAMVSIVYLEEKEDAINTKKLIEKYGGRCVLTEGDVSRPAFCKKAVDKTVKEFGKIDILINNAAVQYFQESIEKISDAQLEKTFRTNIFSMFYLCREAVPKMKKGSSIINTGSVTAYKGMSGLIDYSATKGAISAFTYSLALSLAKKKIRVNAVAPGPIWTPLIPSSFPAETMEGFGSSSSFGRPGEPIEVAPSFLFLAQPDNNYMSGQVIHPNGGTVIHG